MDKEKCLLISKVTKGKTCMKCPGFEFLKLLVLLEVLNFKIA